MWNPHQVLALSPMDDAAQCARSRCSDPLPLLLRELFALSRGYRGRLWGLTGTRTQRRQGCGDGYSMNLQGA